MSIQSSNITSGFIDLATYDELEKYMYGCGDAVAYFVRTTCKSTWFTQVPVVLSNASGQPKFGQSWSVSISRAGDYLLQTWLRVGLNQVKYFPDTAAASPEPFTRIRWTRNLMHNLIKECAITFNDLVAARFDNTHLDFWAAFTVPKGKQLAYNNMIGNTVALTNTSAVGTATVGVSVPPDLDNLAGQSLGDVVQKDGGPRVTYLNLPLPFFYSRDSGVALPTAALPYNEMRINFTFADWRDLLIAERNVTAATANQPYVKKFQDATRLALGGASTVGNTEPAFESVQVWANYAIVSNDERKRMACAPRDILIEQAQMASKVTVTPQTNKSQSIDLRLSHAIKVLFFAIQNITHDNEGSTYTTGSPQMGDLTACPLKFSGQYQVDPLLRCSLVYENTNRLGQMGNDFFSQVNPYFTAPVVPEVSGYHCYSYSLDFICLDPMGSTNYGKLTNVSIVPEFTALCQNSARNNTDGTATLPPLNQAAAVGPNNPQSSGLQEQQKYRFVLTCVNNNIIRISGGALGFPVL
jgi:hypothetical protein